jgi:hypothetical protein
MLNKRNFVLYLLITVFLTFGFSISLQNILADWKAPSQNPPLSNVSKPIFASSSAIQSITNMSGGTGLGLNINGPFVANDAYILGRIGAGTSTPKYPLSVGTQETGVYSPYNISIAGDMLVTGGTDRTWGLFKDNWSTAKIMLMNNGNIALMDGNVGIGSTSPMYPLTVRKASGGGSLGIDIGSYVTGGSYSDVGFFAKTDTAGGKGGFNFRTNAGGGYVDALTIHPTGNVGIKNTNPSAALSVTGNTTISGNLTVGGTITGTIPNACVNTCDPRNVRWGDSTKRSGMINICSYGGLSLIHISEPTRPY